MFYNSCFITHVFMSLDHSGPPCCDSNLAPSTLTHPTLFLLGAATSLSYFRVLFSTFLSNKAFRWITESLIVIPCPNSVANLIFLEVLMHSHQYILYWLINGVVLIFSSLFWRTWSTGGFSSLNALLRGLLPPSLKNMLELLPYLMWTITFFWFFPGSFLDGTIYQAPFQGV